jgi:hypothetical protein
MRQSRIDYLRGMLERSEQEFWRFPDPKQQLQDQRHWQAEIENYLAWQRRPRSR